ncbi:MAG: hypothetical protein IPH82_02750 [Chloroflexi bacterium]|nr:hypothetical protein [Chloroflexota bacterium]
MKSSRERFSGCLHRRYSGGMYAKTLSKRFRYIHSYNRGKKEPQTVTSHDIDALSNNNWLKDLHRPRQPPPGLFASPSLNIWRPKMTRAAPNLSNGLRLFRLEEGGYLPRDAADHTMNKLFAVIHKPQ